MLKEDEEEKDEKAIGLLTYYPREPINPSRYFENDTKFPSYIPPSSGKATPNSTIEPFQKP